ncbi:hypothetical protein BX589_101145 [Paraburkholderia fungorum]|nr:hypothetical protein BX589_101145 [Paraburkholderia fungorum]
MSDICPESALSHWPAHARFEPTLDDLFIRGDVIPDKVLREVQRAAQRTVQHPVQRYVIALNPRPDTSAQSDRQLTTAREAVSAGHVAASPAAARPAAPSPAAPSPTTPSPTATSRTTPSLTATSPIRVAPRERGDSVAHPPPAYKDQQREPVGSLAKEISRGGARVANRPIALPNEVASARPARGATIEQPKEPERRSTHSTPEQRSAIASEAVAAVPTADPIGGARERVDSPANPLPAKGSVEAVRRHAAKRMRGSGVSGGSQLAPSQAASVAVVSEHPARARPAASVALEASKAPQRRAPRVAAKNRVAIAREAAVATPSPTIADPDRATPATTPVATPAENPPRPRGRKKQDAPQRPEKHVACIRGRKAKRPIPTDGCGAAADRSKAPRVGPPHCPTTDCKYHTAPPSDFFWRRGTFTPTGATQPVQRYQCSGCRRTFSDRTFAADFRQHKPGINQAFAELRREGVGLRLAARQLGVSFNTALARSQWLAAQSKVCNQARTPRTRGKKG